MVLYSARYIHSRNKQLIVAYRKSYVCTVSLHSLLIADVKKIYIYHVEAERDPMDAMMTGLEDLSFYLLLYSLPTSLVAYVNQI